MDSVKEPTMTLNQEQATQIGACLNEYIKRGDEIDFTLWIWATAWLSNIEAFLMYDCGVKPEGGE